MGTCKNFNIEYGFPLALVDSMKNNVGFNIGSFVFFEESSERHYKCEIIDIKDNKLCLVGIGWIEKDKCKIN